jgi:ABC-type sugar transport system substrate-binding protein
VIGAVEALKEAGRLGEMKMVSRNGTPKVVQLVRDGIHQGTWDLDIPGIGLLVADLVVRALVGGEKFNGLIMSSQIGQMLDAETIKTWVTWRERVPYNPLIEGLD